MLNKCAIEMVSLSIIAAFDGNSKNLKKICILSTQFRACYIVEISSVEDLWLDFVWHQRVIK
jgi:hypothetical protein